MLIGYICPTCLVEMPEDYPYDHVEIDRSLNGDHAMFLTLDKDGQREVVLTGLARGHGIRKIAEMTGTKFWRLQKLLPPEHPESRETFLASARIRIRQMYDDGQSDATIGLATHLDPTQVGRLRREMGIGSRRRTSRQIRQEMGG